MYCDTDGTAGTQNFGGSLGLDFNVNASIVVTQLGVFDDESNGLNLDLGAQLWSRDDNGTPDDFTDDTGVAVLGEIGFTAADAGVDDEDLLVECTQQCDTNTNCVGMYLTGAATPECRMLKHLGNQANPTEVSEGSDNSKSCSYLKPETTRTATTTTRKMKHE